MDTTTQAHIADLLSDDRDRQSAGFMGVMAATEQPVDWAYDIRDRMVADLSHKDNRQRAHASQILANLAKSDPEQRILRDFDRLLDVTKDERFVTARPASRSSRFTWTASNGGLLNAPARRTAR